MLFKWEQASKYIEEKNEKTGWIGGEQVANRSALAESMFLRELWSVRTVVWCNTPWLEMGREFVWYSLKLDRSFLEVPIRRVQQFEDWVKQCHFHVRRYIESIFLKFHYNLSDSPKQSTTFYECWFFRPKSLLLVLPLTSLILTSQCEKRKERSASPLYFLKSTSSGGKIW